MNSEQSTVNSKISVSKEKILSSIQYATGWALLFLFGYGFVLPIFGADVTGLPWLYPALMLAFFTHAALGVRSTTLRYHLWRSWLDWVFLAVWGIACAVFIKVLYF